MKIRNVHRQPRTIVVTRQRAEPGGVIDVSDELGFSLCDQPVNWEPADAAAVAFIADVLAWAKAGAAEQATVESTPAEPTAKRPRRRAEPVTTGDEIVTAAEQATVESTPAEGTSEEDS